MGAPFSKLVGLATGISYLFVNTKHTVAYIAFDAVKIRERGDSYRLFTSKMTFATTSELVIGTTLLIYLMRKFEREMGSRKITLYCLFINVATIALESFLVANGSLMSFNLRYSGPYPLIGAFFSLYHRHTPRLHPRFFSVLGINFSEKVFHYFWLAQVASSGGWNTCYAIGIGWFAALMYDFLPVVKSLDVPNFLAKVAGDLSSRLLEASPRILVPQAPGRGGGRMFNAPQPRPPQQGNVRPTAAARAPVVADPGATEQLVNMGFSRTQVVEALQSTNNDVNRAAELLLAMQ